jgi:hypothetical protein
MKIGSFSGRADYDAGAGKPLVFAVEMPDEGHILDTKIVLGHKTAHLHLTIVHTTADVLKPVKLLGLLLGQEHDDVREYEFVQRTRTYKFTSEVPPYYLFTAPRE